MIICSIGFQNTLLILSKREIYTIFSHELRQKYHPVYEELSLNKTKNKYLKQHIGNN